MSRRKHRHPDARREVRFLESKRPTPWAPVHSYHIVLRTRDGRSLYKGPRGSLEEARADTKAFFYFDCADELDGAWIYERVHLPRHPTPTAENVVAEGDARGPTVESGCTEAAERHERQLRLDV